MVVMTDKRVKIRANSFIGFSLLPDLVHKIEQRNLNEGEVTLRIVITTEQKMAKPCAP